MKKLLLICAIFLGSVQLSHGQKFWEMIELGTYNIQAIQKEAEIYFNEHGKGKGSGYKQYKAWEYRALSECDTNGNILSPGKIEKEMSSFRAKQPKDKTLAETASWTEIGPLKRNPTSSWNPGVGRVECIAVDPNNYSHILVGAPTGGAWKTTNEGGTWTPLTDNLDNLNIRSVAIDPNNSATYFIGTTLGIYKSTNSGAAWTKVHNSSTIYKIKVKPDNSNIVLAATSSGLLRSTNGGTSFTQVASGTHYDIEFKPATPNSVYACASGLVKYSNDGGATWTNSTGVSGSETRLAVTDIDPTYVYVINSGAAVFRSTNSGVNFTQMTGATPTDVFGGLSWYGMGFAVSNTNKNVVLAGCFELYKSTDGGANFTKHITWTWSGNASTYIHADIHAIEAVGSFIYTGTDGGFHKGANEGSSYTDLTTGLGIRQLYCIGLSKSESGKVVGGAQDNGTAVFRTTDSKWYEWLGADGMEAFVDWSNANTLVGTSQNGSIYISTNNGSSYTGKGKPGGIDGNWVTPIEQDPVDAKTMYVGNSSLYKGTLPTLSWTLVSASPDGGKFTQIKIAPTNNNIFYVSTGANLYKSTDKGITWNSIYTGISGTINSIAIDPNDANRVAVATSGSAKVYVSTNGGTTWTSKLLNLPGITAKALVYSANAENSLYLGMSVGVYYIDDNLTQWKPYGDNLPNISIYELEIDEVGGMVYAGTYGRGIWKTPIYSTTTSAAKDVQLVSIDNYTSASCGLSLSPSITIKNKGSETLNTLTIEVYLNGTLVSTINKTALNLLKNGSTSVSLGSLVGVDGNNSLKVVLSNFNGSADENPTDNEITVNSSLQAGVSHTFYISETSKSSSLAWTISKSGAPVKSSGSITPSSASGISSYNFCLVEDCYDISISNAFNSGSCLTPAWSSSAVYSGDANLGTGKGELVSYNGNEYRAQWWTQNEAPGTNNVWLLIGPCVSSIPTDKLGLKNNQTASTYFETTVANYTSPLNKSFCNGLTLTVDFTASNTAVNSCTDVTFTANVTGGTGSSYVWDFGQGATPASANTKGPHVVQYTTTGSKTISLTVDGTNKTKSDYVAVSQNPALTASVSIALSNGSIPTCSGTEPLTFKATAVNGGTTPIYNWYKGTNVVQSSSSDTYSTSSYNDGDEIRCELVSNLACVSNIKSTSSPISIVVDVCTGTEKVLSSNIKVYPNPVENELNISHSENETLQYKIYNQMGQIVSMGTFTKNKRIDFSTYTNGVYYVEVSLDGEKLITKVVK